MNPPIGPDSAAYYLSLSEEHRGRTSQEGPKVKGTHYKKQRIGAVQAPVFKRISRSTSSIVTQSVSLFPIQRTPVRCALLELLIGNCKYVHPTADLPTTQEKTRKGYQSPKHYFLLQQKQQKEIDSLLKT